MVRAALYFRKRFALGRGISPRFRGGFLRARPSGGFYGAILAIIGLGVGSAFATPPAGGTLNRSVTTGGPVPTKPGEPAKDWRQETEATCGMTCRYHRANDNLTMQALYLVTKIGKVEAELGKNPASESARTALGAFCKDKDEELKACFNRYKDFQRVALLELRQAIGKNEDTMARLTMGRKADGTVEGTALVFDTGEKSAPYLPEVPTLSELETSYLEGRLKAHGSKYTRAEIQKWSQSLVINNPKEKFLEFQGKAAVGNPYQDETATYSLYMENGGPSGKAPPDTKAAALYKQSEKSILELAQDKSPDPGAKVIAPTKNLKQDDQLSYEALVQARSVVNAKIEKDVERADTEEKERKPASEKDPKPKPSGTPSGTPVVNTNLGVSRDVRVSSEATAGRTPSGERKVYEPDEKVQRPAEMKNSRYIKYDLGDIMRDLESLTQSK